MHMVSSNNGQIKLAGSGEQILSDTLALVYSVRETFKEHEDFILNLEFNILKILEGDFDDNIKFFGRFESAEDAKEFLKSVKDKTLKDTGGSTAESIMRDILGDK